MARSNAHADLRCGRCGEILRVKWVCAESLCFREITLNPIPTSTAAHVPESRRSGAGHQGASWIFPDYLVTSRMRKHRASRPCLKCPSKERNLTGGNRGGKAFLTGPKLGGAERAGGGRPVRSTAASGTEPDVTVAPSRRRRPPSSSRRWERLRGPRGAALVRKLSLTDIG